MDTLLVAAAAVALILAAVMSVVAWKLLRESRERSAARVAALEALALVDGDAGADQELRLAPEPIPARPPAPTLATRSPEREPAACEPASEFDEFDDLADEPSWDGALHPDTYAPAYDADASPAHPPAPPLPARTTAGVHVRRPPAPRRPARYAPIAVPDGMFGQAEERGAPPRRWVALAGVAMVVVALAGSAYAMRGTHVLESISWPSLRTTIGGDVQPAPLELLSLRHTTEGTGGFTITGLVQNPATGSVMDHVVAVVYLFDRQGRYFASGRAVLAPDALVPGAESPFTISIPDANGVGRYRVGFRRDTGAVVSHVDRRGHEPMGTTGDAIETIDRGTQPAVTATPIGRVEGN